MKQTNNLQQFTFGFLLAAGLFLLMVLGSSVTAQSNPSAEPESALSLSQAASNIGTAITYQGSLDDGGSPATGTYDFRFQLHDALSGGAQLGEVFVNGVLVENGRFTVQLDFGGNAYAGGATWLEIAVDSGGYQTLTPRQPLTPAPLALNLPNVYTNPNTGFVGIGTDTPVSNSTVFNVKSPSTNNYGGMYVSTSGSSGRPFYGYSANGGDVSAWHYYDGNTGEWRLNVNGTAITVDSSRNMNVAGNVTQSLNSDGLVKAAIYTACGFGATATERDFNNVNDNNISGSQGPGEGRCTIDFGFDISNRYWSATAVNTGIYSIVTCGVGATSNLLSCVRADLDGNRLNGAIMVVIH